MFTRTGAFRVVIAVLLVAWPTGAAGALTIRSWDTATERAGDLFGSGLGTIEYGHLAAALTARGHTILPGINTLTPANLSGVDVFFAGTSSHLVTPAEGAALADFLAHGGCMILEANSLSTEQAAGNAILGALGLGPLYTGILTCCNGATEGTFVNVVTGTTVGALGDVRGMTYASSVACELAPGSGTIVGRVTSGQPTMIEFTAPGHILITGDPYGLNLFQNPAEAFYNPNNEKAYINFIEHCGRVVPTKFSTWGAIKAIYR
jgi:hypothetical protein